MNADDREFTPGFLRDLRSGAPEASRRLDAELRPRLLRFCSGYLRHAQEAEDAAAEVILKVLDSRETPEAVQPWIFRIARNHCLNRMRDAAPRAHEPLASDVDAVARATGPVTSASREDERIVLEAALMRLSPAEREIVRLRYVEDLPREDIGRVLDLPTSVVKSRLFEALNRLRAIHGHGGPARGSVDG